MIEHEHKSVKEHFRIVEPPVHKPEPVAPRGQQNFWDTDRGMWLAMPVFLVLIIGWCFGSFAMIFTGIGCLIDGDGTNGEDYCGGFHLVSIWWATNLGVALLCLWIYHISEPKEQKEGWLHNDQPDGLTTLKTRLLTNRDMPDDF